MLLLAPLLAACTDPPADGLTGTAAVVDDTGRDDSPITKGWIIAVPAASADEVWDAAGIDPPDEAGMRQLNTRLNRDQVVRIGGVIAPLDSDGEFVLPAGEGVHLLCHLESADTGGGELIQGCGFLTLPASGELSISDGEGGFHAEIKE